MLSSLRKMFAQPKAAAYHRRFTRIVMSEPARVSVGDEGSRPAMLDQICEGGARVKTSERLAPGAVVGIDFKTGAGEQQHSLSARVVHAFKDERGFNWYCGLSFVRVDPQESQRLADFIEAERKRRETGFAMPRI